jgi:hypothetical protein
MRTSAETEILIEQWRKEYNQFRLQTYWDGNFEEEFIEIRGKTVEEVFQQLWLPCLGGFDLMKGTF